jgi:hypothetical protein
MQSKQTHYHIRWSDSSLDWKPFSTEIEATELVALIKKRDETYRIEEFDEECGRCKAFLSQSVAS